ncbi:hypothetical protein SKAU_G00190490 [Synaphobranchus kaupii]|uniref:Uncharacterized protein n=1 Tax=Synaphobranchus kaupii TaxID=118154 RepID=A0A9Q1FDW3_SYNKA|nr:hypothetical protein SKAU_G00190490 [Synaphobranchus kaupii]
MWDGGCWSDSSHKGIVLWPWRVTGSTPEEGVRADVQVNISPVLQSDCRPALFLLLQTRAKRTGPAACGGSDASSALLRPVIFDPLVLRVASGKRGVNACRFVLASKGVVSTQLL